jgi:hypothetical protein
MKKKDTGEKPHLKEKKHWVSPGSWVDRVLPGCCTRRSFNKPRPIQSPGQPDPWLTHQAGFNNNGFRVSILSERKNLGREK